MFVNENVNVKRIMKSVIRACLLSVLLLAGAQANAFVMDWDRVVWSADGSAGQYANADGSGVDVSVTITLSDARYDSSDASVVSGTDGSDSLVLSMDAFNHSDRYSHYMDVRIRFSRAVSGVGFDISGVNYGSSGNHGQGNSGYAFDDLIERIGGACVRSRRCCECRIPSGFGNSKRAPDRRRWVHNRLFGIIVCRAGFADSCVVGDWRGG